MTPLGVSVALFMLHGALWILIGVLTALLHGRDVGPSMLVMSPRTDAALFGGAPAELLRSDPALAMLRTNLLMLLAGVLVAAGILIVAIAFFALRRGEAWALAALALAGAAALPFWLLFARPYVAARITLGLGDLPPLIWIPTALLLPATILGWIGLRSGG